MKKKYVIDELIEKEQSNKVWDVTFFGYPIWIHCRDMLSSQVILISSKQYRPSIKDIVKSTYKSLQFLFTQKKYKKVYFLADRVELLEIYKQDKESKKTLFIHHEQKDRSIDIEYISADFFNMLRFIFRKTVYILFYIQYTRYKKKFSILNNDKSIQIAMGDALFLKFLAWCFDNHIPKFYAISVIPPGEKFLNRLNSYEIQHGVIHKEHVGYIGIPKVKNTLILYDKRYMQLLYHENYEGKLELIEYKKNFLRRKSHKIFYAVIYTQPLDKMQKEIEYFFLTYKPQNIWIQRHPKDTYKYNIEEKYFVQNTLPHEVEYPICYTSTVIENFLIIGKNCLIYDVMGEGIKIKEILSIYTQNDRVQLIYYKSLEEIHEYIEQNYKDRK